MVRRFLRTANEFANPAGSDSTARMNTARPCGKTRLKIRIGPTFCGLLLC